MNEERNVSKVKCINQVTVTYVDGYNVCSYNQDEVIPHVKLIK